MATTTTHQRVDLTGPARFPRSLTSDREMAGALLVLSSPSIARRAGRFIEASSHLFSWDQALEEVWSSSERVLVEVATALWTGRAGAYLDGEGLARLGDVVTALDDRQMRRVMAAIELRRGWITFAEALARVAS